MAFSLLQIENFARRWIVYPQAQAKSSVTSLFSRLGFYLYPVRGCNSNNGSLVERDSSFRENPTSAKPKSPLPYFALTSAIFTDQSKESYSFVVIGTNSTSEYMKVHIFELRRII